MFTGLIEATGTVVSLTPTAGAMRLTLAAPALAGRWTTGDSIAVSGVCLTAIPVEDPGTSKPDPTRFAADLAAETLARTTLGSLETGSVVNLELPTPAGSPLGGHVVQGHVDATGTLLSLTPIDPSAEPSQTDWWLQIAVPKTVSRYLVEKGSIAIEGISLTIARFNPDTPDGDIVSVAIIPHTYAATNLHSLKPNQPVNLEADILIKYAEEKLSREQKSNFEITLEYLVANGY